MSRFFFILLCVSALVLSSCGTEATQQKTAEPASATTTDKASVEKVKEIQSSTEKVKKKTKEIEGEVDELLKDF